MINAFRIWGSDSPLDTGGCEWVSSTEWTSVFHSCGEVSDTAVRFVYRIPSYEYNEDENGEWMGFECQCVGDGVHSTSLYPIPKRSTRSLVIVTWWICMKPVIVR